MAEINIRLNEEDVPSGRPIFKYVAYEDDISFTICEEYLPRKKPHMFTGRAKPIFHFFIEYEDAYDDMDYIINVIEQVRGSYYDNLENKEEFINDMNGRVYVYAKMKN
jgi:hypothetical protein